MLRLLISASASVGCGMKKRRMFKTVAVLVALVQNSLLVYQGRTKAVQLSNLPTKLETNSSGIDSVHEPNNITLNDIYITVKTTKSYHASRLQVILKTWFQLAKNQTWFFTDVDDEIFQEQTNGHMIHTKCSTSHNRKDLCCKTSVEYDTYLETQKKWFCHFDDDNYVNIKPLLTVLQKYDPAKEWYLGKGYRKRISLHDATEKKKKYISLWYGTGGAGYCLSRSLALKMVPVAGGGKFISVCEQIMQPEDVTVGYIVGHVLKTNMTSVSELHSHIESMKSLKLKTLKDQISFSYRSKNVLDIHGFDKKYDPTRFLSLHCYFYPHFRFCLDIYIFGQRQ